MIMKRKAFFFTVLSLMFFAATAFCSAGAPPTSPAYQGVTVATKEMPFEPQEIRILAKQYEFIQNKIEVKRNVPLRIILTTADITHGFAIDEFKIDVAIEKGKETIVTFTPTKLGVYEFRCSIFCGVGHHQMRGNLIVQ